MVETRPPGSARFKIASDMFVITRRRLIAGIRASRPDITQGALRQELFLQRYGDEFTPEQRQKNLQAIAAYRERKMASQDA
jgi:hypothetical protein